MKHRIIAALAALMFALGGLVVSAAPAAATGTCTPQHCLALDDWHIQTGGVQGGQVKLKNCGMWNNTSTGLANQLWVNFPDGESLSAGLNLTINGAAMEFVSTWIHADGTVETHHGWGQAPTPDYLHYYYVQITHPDLPGVPNEWIANFYDGQTLALLWQNAWYIDTTGYANELRTGLDTSHAESSAWASSTEMQYYNLNRQWKSGWNTAGNPGTYFGFQAGDPAAGGNFDWHHAYDSSRYVFAHQLGCL
jgi:hypothetical protein